MGWVEVGGVMEVEASSPEEAEAIAMQLLSEDEGVLINDGKITHREYDTMGVVDYE